MSWSSKKKKEGIFVPFGLSEGNIFNICVLAQCILKMRLSGQFQACLFFLTKRFRVHKNTSHLEVYARVKNCYLCCLVLAYFCFVSLFSLVTCFCTREIFSSKKINRLEIVRIASFSNTA